MAGRETKRRWYEEHKEEHKQNCRERNRQLRAKALEILGNACCRCGFSDTRALQIGHRHGGGRQEKLSHNGHLAEIYKKIIERRDSDEYVLLCANCNSIQGFESREITHGY